MADNLTDEAILKALAHNGNYGYGGGDAGHTWPMRLDELRSILDLPSSAKRALSKRLRSMRKLGVVYRYYPTGWRHDPRLARA